MIKEQIFKMFAIIITAFLKINCYIHFYHPFIQPEFNKVLSIVLGIREMEIPVLLKLTSSMEVNQAMALIEQRI